MTPSRRVPARFVALLAVALALPVARAGADEPKPWARAADAVSLAERDPTRIAEAKGMVEAAVAAHPGVVGPRLLAARIAIAEGLSGKGESRKASFEAALAALAKASEIDFRDPEPFEKKGDVYRATGAPKDEVAEALRAVAIRKPGDLVAREAYKRQAGTVPQIRPGDPLPPVVFKDSAGKDVPIASLVGKGVMVIELYRSAVWCNFCRQRLYELDDNQPKFAADNASIVAISPDAPETIAAIEKDKALKSNKPFTLRQLSDPKGAGTDVLGFLNPDAGGPGAAPDAERLPLPTTIVVDERGIVRFVESHLDFRVRTKLDLMLAEVRKAHAGPITPTK